MSLTHVFPLSSDRALVLPLSLAQRIKSRSRIAFEHLYTNYSAALNGVIKHSIWDQQAAEEVLNNVFVKVWFNIDRYDESKSTLFTWMLAICKNEVIDYLRSKSNRQWRLTVCSIDQLPEGACEPGWDRRDLQILMSMLSPADKVIIELVYCRGYSFAQTAELLSMPVGSVKTRARGVIKKWRAKISVS